MTRELHSAASKTISEVYAELEKRDEKNKINKIGKVNVQHVTLNDTVTGYTWNSE